MRVHFHTFGCKANQYDTERVRQEVEARGASTVGSVLEADVVVVNTCTVTHQADAEARRFVRKAAASGTGPQVVVMGCSAALCASRFHQIDGVRAVIGGHDPVRIAGAVVGPMSRILRAGAPPDARLAEVDQEPIGGVLLRARVGGARGWLKIQDGCDRRCSFCATVQARGPSRSRSPRDVVAEARLLAESHAEVVLTGIHIGGYGADLDPRWTLSRLVAHLLEEVPGVRFRLGSVEATEIDEEMVDLLVSSHGALAPHLHMPLQSGADPVLRRMRRWHTASDYRARALRVVERVSPLGLGADLIAGFPGETEEDHRSTLRLVDEIPFTYLHVFPYSPREGTVAAGLPEQVPQRIAGARARELRALADEKGRAYRAGRVGSSVVVAPELDGEAGVSGDYLRVGIRGRTADPARTLLPGTLRGEGDDLYIAAPDHPWGIEG